MKSFFVNNHGRPDCILDDYQSTVHEYRSAATQGWRENNKVYTSKGAFSIKELPAFFIDKYGFRCWLAHIASTIPSEFTSIPDTDFSNLFNSYDETVRNSVVGSSILGTSAPSVDEPVFRSPFLEDLFSAWQRHLSNNGIDLPSETIDWYFSVSLLEVYRNSVFYPRHPVLWGPNYFGKIAIYDQEYILSHYGKNAVWDSYFFMMVCHLSHLQNN